MHMHMIFIDDSFEYPHTFRVAHLDVESRHVTLISPCSTWYRYFVTQTMCAVSLVTLREFEINLDQKSSTTVIVGRNDTGKLNLLEALVIIFCDLDLGECSKFKYELLYFCRNHKVQIDADPARERNAV